MLSRLGQLAFDTISLRAALSRACTGALSVALVVTVYIALAERAALILA
jgi:hypothetical protein